MEILATILLIAVVVLGLIGWGYFCFKNPGTASLIWLISALLGSE